MTIQQLSVFLENKSGRLLEVTKVLGENILICPPSVLPIRLISVCFV